MRSLLSRDALVATTLAGAATAAAVLLYGAPSPRPRDLRIGDGWFDWPADFFVDAVQCRENPAAQVRTVRFAGYGA